MKKKVVAIMGSYRRGCAVDSIVDEVLRGAEESGAEAEKIYLDEKHIEFCTNCRACTQTPGKDPGECPLKDDFREILSECLLADALVIGAPVNFYNINALTRRWLERHVATAYWPWRSRGGPKFRNGERSRKAVLVTASACPAIFVPFATGAVRALKAAAACLGAVPVETIIAGLMGEEPKPVVPKKILAKARKAGQKIAG